MSNLWQTIKLLIASGVEGFWKLLPWIFLALGVGAIMIASFFIDRKEHESLHSFTISVGSLLLSAGVFAVLLKSFQYIKVFREELLKIFEDEKFEAVLRKVMYGDHADEHARLRALEHAAKQCLSQKSPPLYEQLVKALMHYVNAAGGDGYYRHFKRTINIVEYKSEDRELSIDDEVFIELIPREVSSKISYKASIQKTSGDTRGELSVNGIDCSNEIKIENGSVKYHITLEGSASYKIDRKYQKIFRLPMEPYMHLRLTRYAENLSLKIQNLVADKVGVLVKPCGFDPEISKWSVEESDVSIAKDGSKTKITVNKPSLTLPNQGYIIVLYQK